MYNDDRIVFEPEIVQRTGLSEGRRRRLSRLGLFPQIIQLTPTVAGVRHSELPAWLLAPADNPARLLNHINRVAVDSRCSCNHLKTHHRQYVNRITGYTYGWGPLYLVPLREVPLREPARIDGWR